MTDRKFPVSFPLPYGFGMPALPEIDRPPRLLLVDDDPGILGSLRELLHPHGFELVTASNGEDATRQITEQRFDLVLLDHGLPDMSGLDVMDFIKRENIEVSVIVISGDTEIDTAIGALERGAFNFLRKPFPPESLLKTINNALQKRTLEKRNRQIGWQLEYSEKLYRNLIDNSPDIICTFDQAGRFTFVNDRVQQTLGYRPNELLGKHYSLLVHEDDLGRAHYLFNDRRTEARAQRNIELRLRGRHNIADERIFDLTLMTVSFNSTGMYIPDTLGNEREYSGAYVIARDVSDRKRAEELISYQTHHDILTDLPNRLLFKEQLSLAIIQARRKETLLAIMMLNLDRFKLVNDTLGHVKGDELLQQVAYRLRQCLCEEDMPARLGGDEFGLILPCLTNREEASAKAGKILASLNQPFVLDGFDVHISASIGIAIYPEDGESSNDLIRHADIAMYQIKAQGKDGVGFYDDSMQDLSHETITLEKKLRKALENGELEMYYQPQTEISTGKILGVEALMRWNHPERGVVSAGEFLPIAEECGLMLPLSDWMLGAVSRDILACQAAGCPPIRFDVNVSPQSLEHRDFCEKLNTTLDRYRISPERIGIEITENICIRNPQNAIEQLNKLSHLGINVAIDDFGTGYSSLAYLHRFPIGTIKLDQMFVREIQSAEGHFPVVLAIISIARGLGLRLVAEGVETEIQSRYLEQAGCQVMQGYLLHRPMPRGKLIELLLLQATSQSN
ncbi:MAG: two-component system response regulator [Burkholderiaceae bacterium]|nr:two-component system response regulator [Burkholderiaceae bacterium]